MTPYETAMRFMRQRDTTVSHPDFIVAYLREEANRTVDGDPMRLSPNTDDQIRRIWKNLKTAFAPFAAAAARVAEASTVTSHQMERLREAYEDGVQFQNDTSDQPFGRIR